MFLRCFTTLVLFVQDDRAQSCKAASTRGNQGGDDWLGTWAKRQVHYAQPPPPSLPAHIPGTPQPSDRSVARRPLRSTEGDSNDAAECTDDNATPSVGPENSEEIAAGMRCLSLMSADHENQLAAAVDSLVHSIGFCLQITIVRRFFCLFA